MSAEHPAASPSPRPYYEDDLVTLYHADCAEVLPTLSGIDLIFTSPPYNLGVSAGAIYYNHKTRVQAQTLWTPFALNPGLPVRQVIIWARAGGMNFAPTHYVPTHEWIIVFAKPEFRLKSKGASGVGDVWRVPQEASEHPAPFPLGLPARAIESVGPSLVLDPFAGSGTTLRAAKDAGVRAIGIEKSERYCEMIVKRLGQEALNLAV